MLGERIANLRKKRKLSQYELAERLGFSRGKLANYEQGSRQPDYDTLKKIADFFDVTTDYLLGHDDQPLPGYKMVPHRVFRESTVPKGIKIKYKDFVDVTKENIPLDKLKEQLAINFPELSDPLTQLLFDEEEKTLYPNARAIVFPSKDEKDIAKRMEQIRKDLTSEDGLMFNGEPMTDEAVESFLEAMEYAVRQTQRINKKYIPKKYRNNEDN